MPKHLLRLPHRLPILGLALLGALLAATPAFAQISNPADATRSNANELKPTPEQRRAAEGHATRLPSYDQPALPGTEAGEDGLTEEEHIGAYGQPRWTAHRRFATTRVFVRPQGFFELEWWIRPEVPRGGGPTSTLTQFEGELGLGHRLQLDFYLSLEKEGHKSENGDENLKLAEESVELRYALADWDVIPLNPTLYIEYVAKNGGADGLEMKLLLGGEIAPRWHWGVNAVFERELSGDLTNEYAVTGGISYCVFDTNFSIGAETKCSFSDTKENRGDLTENCRVGPSIQWRPVPAAHIDIAMLFGIGGHSNVLEPFIVAGWEF